MSKDRQTELLREALKLVVARCPGLATSCYWAGTAAMSVEDLDHRGSFDLDFHTLDGLADVRPLLAELQSVFGEAFELVQAPAGFGSGFSGTLRLAGGDYVTVEVLSNYEDVEPADLVVSSTAPAIRRVAPARYLADKVQCVAERVEARDLVDITAVLRKHPRLERAARVALRQQDALIVAERLLGWTDDAVREDLEAYPDVDPGDAIEARERLLGWLEADAADGGNEP